MPTTQDKDINSEKGECEKELTYVFSAEGGKPFLDLEIRSKIWQIVPSFCGCLFCVIFGIMLGWPSPTYPKLLLETSPLPITFEQSPMIAGFLMAGYILGIPLSNFTPLGTKYGILLTLFCITCGWLLMWQARNIFWLLGSRCLIGLSNGYGLGQLRQYISELCEPKLAMRFTKSLNIFVIMGILIAVSVGPYVDFRLFSIMVTCLSIVVFFTCVFLPHSPMELVRFGKMKQAKSLLVYLKPNVNADVETQKMKMSLDDSPEQWNLGAILRNGVLRKNFFVLTLLVFFQQFSGPPATIVYCQIMFAKFGTPHADVFAIIYVGVFFFGNVLGCYHFERYNKKYCLLFSGFTASIFLIINALLVFFDYNKKWSYCSAVIMCLFIFTYTIGLGCVPFAITEKLFPKAAMKVVVQAQVMLYSIFAIVVTKVTQVLMSNFEFYAPFFLFTCAAVLSTLFVLIFIPQELPVLQVDTQRNVVLV